MCICFVKEHQNLVQNNNNLKSQLNDLSLNNEQLADGNNKLQDQIDILKEELKGDNSQIPIWLDSTQIPYKPLIDVEGEQIGIQPIDIYMECPTLRDIATSWRTLDNDTKLWTIWKFVINDLVYSYDKDDNWQPPIVTHVRKKGDCEDGTILFITLCRLAHVNADSVFNACGYYHSNGSAFGHSYPIAKMNDGRWYIFESTLDSIPSAPKLFQGSNYTADWGYANWQYTGKGPQQVESVGINIEEVESVKTRFKKNDDMYDRPSKADAIKRQNAIQDDWND